MANNATRAQAGARNAAREAASWVEPLARAGYAAKGTVFVIIGVLAAQAAFGSGGQVTDTTGALREVLEQPFGQFLLVLIGIGLFGYALWKVVQAVKDPERKGTDAKGIATRGAYAIIAVVYAGLAVEAVRLAMSGSSGGSGGAGSGGGSGAEHWTAQAMQLPAGRWLVGLAGAAIILYGLVQLRKAKDGDIRKRLDLGELGADTARWVVHMGQVGVAARAVVFGIVGWFLIDAALSANAQEAGGLAQALNELGSSGYGPWLLGVVALGLVAYGAWQLVKARYRRIWM